MTKRLALLAVAFVSSVAFVLITGGAANAQQPEPDLSLRFRDGVATGSPLQLAATLLDPAGNPIAGALISFSIPTEFLNNTGDMDIGWARTGANGMASLDYAPRIEGEREITAIFDGNAVFAPSSITETLTVEQGPVSYRELSPVRVPGANKWMAAAVLLVVWGLFLSSMARIWLIARIGARTTETTETAETAEAAGAKGAVDV